MNDSFYTLLFVLGVGQYKLLGLTLLLLKMVSPAIETITGRLAIGPGRGAAFAYQTTMSGTFRKEDINEQREEIYNRSSEKSF